MMHDSAFDTILPTTRPRLRAVSLRQPYSSEERGQAEITPTTALSLPAAPVPPSPLRGEIGATAQPIYHGRVLRPLNGPTRYAAEARSTLPGPIQGRHPMGSVQTRPSTIVAPMPVQRSAPLTQFSPLLVLLPLLLSELWLIGEEALPRQASGRLAVFPSQLALAPLLGMLLVLAALEIGVLARLTRIFAGKAAPSELSWSYLIVLFLSVVVLWSLLWLGLTGYLSLEQINGPLWCDLAALALAQWLLLRAMRGPSILARA